MVTHYMLTAVSQPACKDARVLVVMGSTGCGKSTVGKALALQLNAVFIEGDDHHTAENKAKMSSGLPLTDEDRWPWLEQLSEYLCSTDERVVLSCSALKKKYRQFMSGRVGEPVLYVYLHGSRQTLERRLSERQGHFMNKFLLDSQLAALEVPDSTEFSIRISIDQTIEQIVAEAMSCWR